LCVRFAWSTILQACFGCCVASARYCCSASDRGECGDAMLALTSRTLNPHTISNTPYLSLAKNSALNCNPHRIERITRIATLSFPSHH